MNPTRSFSTLPSRALPMATLALGLMLVGVMATGQTSPTGPTAAPIPGAGSPAAGIPLPSLRAVVSERGVTLLGVVPDGLERDLIVRRAKRLYGPERVTDLLRVGDVGNPAWLSADFLPDLTDATQASAVLENGTLVVEGEVRSRVAQERIAASLAELRARGVVVELRLRVAAEAQPR